MPLALHQLLKTYSFPGNVRELEALVFDAVARHQGVTLALASFKEAIFGNVQSPVVEEGADVLPDRLPTLRESEDRLIDEALRRADGNQGVAAGLLRLSRQALNKRLSRRRDGDGAADQEAPQSVAESPEPERRQFNN